MKQMSLMLIVIVDVLIILNSLAWAQFTHKPQQKLTITPPAHPTNGANYVGDLKQRFNLSQINFLDLIHFKKNDANFFQNSSLAAFSEVNRLTINSGEIDTLPQQALKGLKKLKHLNISNTGIREIPADLFHYTPTLQNLILCNNKIAKLPTNMFQNVSLLFNLDLHSNELVSLHREVFKNLTFLYELLLNDNKLTILGQDVFHDLGSRLFMLNLSFNQIGSFDHQIFAKFNKLTDLLLVQAFNANITTLPSNIFLDLARVEDIRLDGNNLEYLPDNIFHQNVRLQTLSLANNKFTALNDVIFQENTRLQSLYLNDNQLKFLSQNVFSKLTELRELRLDNNQLTFLSPSIFSQLTNLQTIWISNNSVNMAGPDRDMSNLYNSPNIELIYAANNSITQIYGDWLQQKQLDVLDLRSNPIVETKVVPSRFLSDHVSIYLTNRNAPEIKLRKMTLLELDSSAGRKIIMDKNSACGSNCSCVLDIDFMRNRTVLKCVRFNEKELLEKIPPHIAQLFASFNIELKLSNCNLTSLYPLKGWLQQLNVTKLSLSDNHLSHLDGLPELPRLKILELHNNEFTSIDEKTLRILRRSPNLTTITLHDNPWICECSSKNFFDFLLHSHPSKKIMKPNKVICDNLNKEPLLKVANQTLCYNTQTSVSTPTAA